MNSTVIAVDLAKDVFEVAVASHTGKILERLRLNRAQFHRFLIQREPATVVPKPVVPHITGVVSPQSTDIQYVSYQHNTSLRIVNATKLTKLILKH